MFATEISERSGRAQSTVSSHLDSLTSRLLLECTSDPADCRRKIYSLKGQPLLHVDSSANCTIDEFKEIYKEVFLKYSKNKEEFYKEFCLALVMTAEKVGVDVSPMITGSSALMASIFAAEHKDETIEQVMVHVKEYFKTLEIAEISVHTYLPFTVVMHIREGDLAASIPNATASIYRGFFPTLMSYMMKRPYGITYEEGFGPGNKYSKITLEPIME